MILYFSNLSASTGEEGPKPVIPRIIAVFYILVFLAGCPQTQPTEDLNDIRDEVLSKYFTDPAIAVLDSIPLRSASFLSTGIIPIDDDLEDQMLAQVLGLPPGAQIVVSSADEATNDSILCYYTYMTHERGLIDLDEFTRQFDIAASDPAYTASLRNLEKEIDAAFEDNYFLRIGAVVKDDLPQEMLMSSAIVWWIEGAMNLPNHLLDVYKDTIRIADISRQ